MVKFSRKSRVCEIRFALLEITILIFWKFDLRESHYFSYSINISLLSVTIQHLLFKSSCSFSSPSALMSPIHLEEIIQPCWVLYSYFKCITKDLRYSLSAFKWSFFMSLLLLPYIFPNSYSLLMTLFPTSSRKLNYQKTTSSAPNTFTCLLTGSNICWFLYYLV